MAHNEWGSVKTASGEGTFSSQTRIIFEIAWKNYALKPNKLWKQCVRYGLDSCHPHYSVRLAAWCQLKLCSSVPYLEHFLQCQVNSLWSNGTELYQNLYVLIPNIVLLRAKTVSSQRSQQAPWFVWVWMWCVPCTYCDREMFLFLQSDQQLDCALDLMRRLPPQQIEKNLSDLIDLVSGGCSGQVMAESWWQRPGMSEHFRRHLGGVVICFSPFRKVEEYSCPNNIRNLRVYFGQANKYHCICMKMLLSDGSLAAFLVKSSPV